MSEVDIYKGIAKKQVKQAVLDMYKLAGDNDLYYYKQIQEIIDYIAELEMKIDKAVEYIQNHQLVFQLSTMEQIVSWFDEFYKDTMNILRG